MFQKLDEEKFFDILNEWGYKIKENDITVKIKNDGWNKAEWYKKNSNEINIEYYCDEEGDHKRLIVKRNDSKVLFWKDGKIWTEL